LAEKKAERIRKRLNVKIAKLRDKAEKKITSEHERAYDLLRGLHQFAEKNREQLTNSGKKKKIKLKTGYLFWHRGKPAVIFDKKKEPQIISSLLKRKLKAMTRVRLEIDKLMVARSPEKLKGIRGLKIDQNKFFTAKPKGLEKGISLKIK
jgi:phage host-nuclease inhibitor protein Gam